MCQSQTSPSSPSLRGTSFREKPNIPLRYTLMTKKNFVSFRRGGFSREEACTIHTLHHTNVNLHHHYHHLILHTPAQSSRSSAPAIRPLVCKSSDHPLSRCQDLRSSIFLHTTPRKSSQSSAAAIRPLVCNSFYHPFLPLLGSPLVAFLPIYPIYPIYSFSSSSSFSSLLLLPLHQTKITLGLLCDWMKHSLH